MRWRVVKQLQVTPQLDFSKGAHRFGLCLDPPSEKKSNTNFPTVPMLFPQALVFALTAGFLNCFWAPSLELCINTLGYLGGILTSPYKQKPGDGSLPRWCICECQSLGSDSRCHNMCRISSLIFHAASVPDVCQYVRNLTAGVWLKELDIPKPCLLSFDFLD